MQTITPCLWIDDRIADALEYYVSVFKGRVLKRSAMADGRLLVASFEILGQEFQLLNGGPLFKFSEAVSFTIDCKDQAEVDYYWNTLTADGGEESQCGWLKDKYGLSWQVVPQALPRYLADPDRAKADRVMQAMMKMHKIVVADLDRAAAAA